MALLPGTKGVDILAWRGVAELVGEIRAKCAERMSHLPYDESADLLRGLGARLEEEIAFEEGFAARFSQAMAALDLARYEDDLAPLLPRFNQLAEEYFRKRESVLALHNLCNTYRDALVRRVLQRVEELFADEGMGRAPAPWCWLATGSAGRGEQTFCVDPSYLLVHGDIPDDGSNYFGQFAYHALAFMEKIGLVKNDGRAAVMKNLWRGSRREWRGEFVGELLEEDRKRLSELAGRADLRLIHGDGALAAELLNIVWSMLEFRRGELRGLSRSAAMPSLTRAVSFPLQSLRDMAKGIAEMPSGLDFFSRLRVERSGSHRGEFDLEQFAIAPLVANVRMLAINYGLHEPGTIARIKGLQEREHLSVDLTERLLRAYHEFTRLKVIRQITAGCDNEQSCFIDPQALSADGEYRLRAGLEAVSGLEKIAYLLFTEQG